MMNKIVTVITIVLFLAIGVLFFYLNHLVSVNEQMDKNEAIRQEVAKHQEDNKEIKQKIKDRYINQVKWDKDVTEEVNNEIKQHSKKGSDSTYTIVGTDTNTSN